MSYLVIENTPGYLPDADEPVSFESVRDANEYLREEVERYCDSLSEAGLPFRVEWSGDYPDESWQAFVIQPGRTHDLGRVFEIVEEEGI